MTNGQGCMHTSSDMAFPMKRILVVDYPKGFDFFRKRDWHLESVILVHDPLSEAEPGLSFMEIMRVHVNELFLAVAYMRGGASG